MSGRECHIGVYRNQFGYGRGEEYADSDKAKSERALLLWKAGFIEAIDAGTMAGPAILTPALTWQGHDLLDTLRSLLMQKRVEGCTPAGDKRR